MLIKDMKPGDKVEAFYIIKDFNLKTSSNNKKYLDLNLMDSTGDINSKLWDLQNSEEEFYKAGMVVKLRGDVTLWQNVLQLKIVKMRPIGDDDDVDYTALVPSAPYEFDTMYREIIDFVERITDEEIKRLVSYILDKNRSKLEYYPAAKRNHHAIRAGLTFHILRMLRLADSIATIYDADKSLLFAGVILHDMEKINEMESDELGIVGEYTNEGNLLGHIIQGVVSVGKLGEELSISHEKIMLIQHMILSHHYEADFGSPKKPMFLEAELLHYIDMIDARVYDFQKVYLSLKPGEISDFIPSLEKRKIYRPGF